MVTWRTLPDGTLVATIGGLVDVAVMPPTWWAPTWGWRVERYQVGEETDRTVCQGLAIEGARAWLQAAAKVLADDVRARSPVKGAPKVARLNWWRPDVIKIRRPTNSSCYDHFTIEPGDQCESRVALPAAVRLLDRMIDGAPGFRWRAGAVEGECTTREAAREAAVDSSLEQTRAALAELAAGRHAA